MSAGWLDAAGRFFNPDAVVRELPLPEGRCCVVVDDALANPEGLVAWAARQTLLPPIGVPYPGLVLPAPADIASRSCDFFAQHIRARLGGRRTLGSSVRVSMVTLAPDQLGPMQWQCHRDIVAAAPDDMLFAASVLYLFRDPALGGTSFYRPRRPMHEIQRMVEDSLQMDAAEFSRRYGVQPGYMVAGNAHFEHIGAVPAAWNRMVFYDGGQFHSGDVERTERLSLDPARGRLTLNGFFTCRRQAG